MKLKKTMNGDWINLSQAQSLYVAEMTEGPFAKSNTYRLAIYARYSPSQVYVLSVFEPSEGELTQKIKNSMWMAANHYLDELVAEVNQTQSVVVSGVKITKDDIETLNSIKAAIESLSSILTPDEKFANELNEKSKLRNAVATVYNATDEKPKKRTPRKAKDAE